MKVIGNDGKEYTLNLVKQSKDFEDTNQSLLHLEAKALLKQVFPNSKIYEEIILVGCRGYGGTLVADFFIPDFPILIEVHGSQHYKYSKFFHKSQGDFEKYKNNDVIKKEWARNNNIIYIELPFDKIKEWKNIINDYIS